MFFSMERDFARIGGELCLGGRGDPRVTTLCIKHCVCWLMIYNAVLEIKIWLDNLSHVKTLNNFVYVHVCKVCLDTFSHLIMYMHTSNEKGILFSKL